MRISRLELAAFGPFTGRVLKFTGGGSDLHVIYGANEAGKSSSLRALRAWLFGFPERTTDDFIHPRASLLVGGELCRDDQCLEFFRLKKRKGDIVDREGSPLDPALLEPFLGGLDAAVFQSLYAIDHDVLVRGGREILARRGELGEILFSAGADLGSLHRALEGMEAEKMELYRIKGRNQRINQRIRLHHDLKKEIRELCFSPEKWQQYAQTHERLSRELTEMNSRRQELDRRRRHLERLHRTVPLLARRRAICRQLEELGSCPVLPPDFGQQSNEVQQELRSLRQRLAQAQARKKLIMQELDRLAPRTALAGKTTQIESLYQRLGAYNKAKKDRPRLEGMRTVLLRDAARLLETVIPDSGQIKTTTAAFAPLVRQKKKILALAAEQGEKEKSLRDAGLRLTAVREELDRTDRKLAQLAAPSPPVSLQTAVDRAFKAGNLDERIGDLQREIADADRIIRSGMQRLGCGQETPVGLIGFEPAPMAIIRKFGTELDDLLLRRQQLADKEQNITAELLAVRTRMQELSLAGEVPSEQELVRIRQRRDTGWRLLCRQWLEGDDVTRELEDFAPEGALHETVYSLMQQADAVGDRLRFEADRVQTFAALQAKEDELQARRQENKLAREESAAALVRHRQEWQELWQPLGVVPGNPADMVDWRSAIEKLQDTALGLQQRQQELERMQRTRFELRRAVVRELTDLDQKEPAGETLEPVLTLARGLLERLRSARQQYEQLCQERELQKNQLRQAEREVEESEKQRREWQRNWQETAILPEYQFSFTPDEAQDLFDAIGTVQVRIKDAGELESRMRGIDRDCREFEREVAELASLVAPGLQENAPERVVPEMYDLLTAAGKEQALHEQYSRELHVLAGEISESELALASCEQELARLLDLAGCRKEDELITARQKSEEHNRLTEQLRQLEQDLQQMAEGATPDELTAQIREVDTDSLPGEIHALEQEIERELDPAIQRLAEQKGEAKKMLEQMDGSGRAARKAEELEDNLAHLRRDAQRYLRLQLGVELLRREIERFRRQNQGPVLSRASDIFADLTLGSFSGLKTDVDDRSEPVLVGVRPDSAIPIPVAAMSTGSRDQLYLALRLASLAHRAEQGRPMPYIFDDILINFDEARSTAALKVLAGLGGTNQLILFTHQRQVARRAERIAGVTVHYLEQ